MPDADTKILVTVGGECFSADYIGVRHPDGRDGVVYDFKLTDLIKDRGLRNVSLSLSGTDRIFIEDFDARIENLRLNFLRRAFDSDILKFETLVVSKYQELNLRATDFQPPKRSSDERIRRFIKFGTYCLGFKCCPNNAPNLYVDFECPEDLEYLGVKSEDMGRNVRLLTEEGYLRYSSARTYANALRVSPTSKLIREFEPEDNPNSTSLIGATVTQNFYIHGHNPRVNMNSTDNSVNVTSVSGDQLFVRLRDAVRSVTDEAERVEILSKLDALQQARGSNGFLDAYQSFIASVADYMTIFGPFIPALTQMLSGQ
jgi:hypothetical protein